MSSCPICAKPSTPDNRPFCSKRCADVDLARWLGGTYRIGGTQTEDGADETALSDQGNSWPNVGEEKKSS